MHYIHIVSPSVCHVMLLYTLSALTALVYMVLLYVTRLNYIFFHCIVLSVPSPTCIFILESSIDVHYLRFYESEIDSRDVAVP